MAGAAPVQTFKAQALTGRTIDFPGDYRGQLVLLDFWATWCGPCRAELPHLKKAQEEFGPRGLAVVGVSLDAAQRVPAGTVQRFVQDQKLPGEQVYEDGLRIAAAFGVSAIPAAFLIDCTTGRILASGDELRGSALFETLRRQLQARGG